MSDEVMKCGHKEHRYKPVPLCLDCQVNLRAQVAALQADLARVTGELENLREWYNNARNLVIGLERQRDAEREKNAALLAKIEKMEGALKGWKYELLPYINFDMEGQIKSLVTRIDEILTPAPTTPTKEK